MVAPFPTPHVGDPLRFETLAVFPLFTSGDGGVEYLLSDEALATNLVRVEEISEQGSVLDLFVENQGDLQVLFLEGEELVGAKQNRVLNASVLIAAQSKVRIPVSCVEQGRWNYNSRRFASGGRHAPAKLRYALKASVNKSLRAKRGHRSDQGEVWDQVAAYEAVHDLASPTGAMADTFEALETRIAEARKQLPYVDGASGLAIALGKKIVAVELFDKPLTCRKVWDRALSGFILDALEEQPREPSRAKTATTRDVEQVIGAAGNAQWAEAPPVGVGKEYRAEFDQSHASALCFEDHLVHGSVVGT